MHSYGDVYHLTFKSVKLIIHGNITCMMDRHVKISQCEITARAGDFELEIFKILKKIRKFENFEKQLTFENIQKNM